MQPPPGESRQIGAVVYDEQGLGFAAQTGDQLELFEYRPREKPFVTELENRRSSFEDLFGYTHGIYSTSAGNFVVKYGVKPRQHAKAPDPGPACRAGRSK